MAADKTEHFEVWYVEPDTGKERHRKADDLDQATEIATELSWDGFDDVTVHKLTTSVSSSQVSVDIPDKPAEEEAEVTDA